MRIVFAFALLFTVGCSRKAYTRYLTNEEIVSKTKYCRDNGLIPKIQYDNGWEMNLADIVCIPVDKEPCK